MNSNRSNLTYFISPAEIAELELVDAHMIRPDSNNETMTFDCGYFSKARLHCDGMMDWIGPIFPKQQAIFTKITGRIYTKLNPHDYTLDLLIATSVDPRNR